MLLQNIMSNYLNENTTQFEVENQFKPITIKKSSWQFEEKRITKTYKFDEKRFLEQFIVQVLKYNRETNADIEVRFREDTVGIIIHAVSPNISEIETEASKDIDKIKKDVMYYYAK